MQTSVGTGWVGWYGDRRLRLLHWCLAPPDGPFSPATERACDCAQGGRAGHQGRAGAVGRRAAPDARPPCRPLAGRAGRPARSLLVRPVLRQLKARRALRRGCARRRAPQPPYGRPGAPPRGDLAPARPLRRRSEGRPTARAGSRRSEGVGVTSPTRQAFTPPLTVVCAPSRCNADAAVVHDSAERCQDPEPHSDTRYRRAGCRRSSQRLTRHLRVRRAQVQRRRACVGRSRHR